MTTLEARAYGPDSTPEEIEAMRARVSLYHGDIVLYDEMPVVTPFTIGVCYDRVEELVDAHGCEFLIVDVRNAGQPDAATRKGIKQRVERLKGRISHVAVAMTSNPLITVTARFIQALVPIPLTIHGTVEQAEEALRHGRR